MTQATKETEMEYMKQWCIVVLDFIAAKNVGFKDFSELTKENLNKSYKSYSRKFFEGLQQVYRDVNEMAKTLPPHQYHELNIKLNDRFKKDLEMAQSTTDQKIENIINKGKISNLAEYELLLNHVEAIYLDADKKKQIEKINVLLANYHQKDISR